MHQKMWLGRSNCETNVRQQPGGSKMHRVRFFSLHIYIYICIDHIYVPALVGGGVCTSSIRSIHSRSTQCRPLLNRFWDSSFGDDSNIEQ